MWLEQSGEETNKRQKNRLPLYFRQGGWTKQKSTYSVKNLLKILIPLPSYGFDPTEAAIPWKLLKGRYQIFFATPNGKKAQADEIMVTGNGLKMWRRLLMARTDAVTAYAGMIRSKAFSSPMAYSSIDPDAFDALFLPGGHHKGVREYLESDILQGIVPYFFSGKKKVAAVCHGVILLARSKNPVTNKPVIHTRQTTSLLKSQELLAYNLTKFWLGDYYLTYPGTTVEDEVKSALKTAEQFQHGPKPVFRDTRKNLKHGFAVRDGNYVSARWPGDIYTLTHVFNTMLTG